MRAYKTSTPLRALRDLWVLQARAEAALGDRHAAVRSLLESERLAESIDVDSEPEWARFIDPAYLADETANAFDDLGMTAESMEFAQRSAAEAAQQGRARRGSLAHAALARSALAGHDLELAVAEATTTVELAVAVKSSRSLEARSRPAISTRGPRHVTRCRRVRRVRRGPPAGFLEHQPSRDLVRGRIRAVTGES